MSLSLAIGASVLRAVAAALLAWGAASLLDRHLRARSGGTARGIWGALVALAIMPPLVISYAWSHLVPPGGAGPLLVVTHTLLLAGKWLPAAVVALHFAPPPPLVPTASFALDLAAPSTELGRRIGLRWWWRVLHGPGRRHLLAVFVVFLLAFQDFELSSLMMQPAWTVWLFDAQVGGLPLSTTLLRAAAPLAIEGVVIALIVWILWTRGPVDAGRMPVPAAPRGTTVSLLLAAAVVCTVGVPVGFVFGDTLAGIGTVLRDGSMLREIAISLGLCAIATAIALLSARSLLRTRAVGGLIPTAASLPGACGSLVIALAIQALFATPILAAWYDTPLPMLLAAALWLLPLAIVLTATLGLAIPTTGSHTAALLTSGSQHQRRAGVRLLSALVGHKRMWVAGILFCAYYFEVVGPALLAPAAMTPAAVRLYNLMHYGHSDVLSAMVSLMLVILVAALGIAFSARGLWLRRGVHV